MNFAQYVSLAISSKTTRFHGVLNSRQPIDMKLRHSFYQLSHVTLIGSCHNRDHISTETDRYVSLGEVQENLRKANLQNNVLKKTVRRSPLQLRLKNKSKRYTISFKTISKHIFLRCAQAKP